jgi:hypothetical protein
MKTQNHLKTIQFIREHGNPGELARLDFLLDRKPAPQPVRAEFQATQRADGGWN